MSSELISNISRISVYDILMTSGWLKAVNLQKFAENTTNSDIIDAYELSDAKGVGSVSSYIGACYHGKKFIIRGILFCRKSNHFNSFK